MQSTDWDAAAGGSALNRLMRGVKRLMQLRRFRMAAGDVFGLQGCIRAVFIPCKLVHLSELWTAATCCQICQA